MTDAYVALEGDRVVEARARAPGCTRGELVFTTAYTGYEESLTDPSYEEQILTFSYPLIGNYGVRPERFESERVHPRGVVARELTSDVAEWLEAEGVPAVDHLDTRDIVTEIRDTGAMKCGIAAGPDVTEEDALDELHECKHMSDHTDIGAQVSTDEAITMNEDGDGPDVALVDCGAKGSIVSSLVDRDATVHLLPYDATRQDVESYDPDVLFISNGPGDPEKMEFGHRGVNQPVRDLRTDKVVMTTQNHGYTVADPGDRLTVTQVNVNDDTPEGLESDDLNVITRQYHPEAHPGPHDSLGFFDDVLALAEDEYAVTTPN